MRRKIDILLVMVLFAAAFNAFAQQPPKKVSLVFRETFKGKAQVAPTEVNLTTAGAANPNLELKLYGGGAKPQPDHESGLHLLSQADPLTGDEVSYVWSGVTEGNWAVTLRDKTNYVDLTGPARIRWRVRMRGFHELHPMVKLADGTMLVADYSEPESTYWRETEFYIVDVPRWRVLDPAQVVESRDSAWRTNVDLSKVDEIGFTDLSRGAGHGLGGNSGVDWIEVYGNPVKR
jgi:hypothetical protein